MLVSEMPTLTVEIPDEMDAEIDAFLENHPHYLNSGELVRDAIRHLLTESLLSSRTLEDDRRSREQIDGGDVVVLDDV